MKLAPSVHLKILFSLFCSFIHCCFLWPAVQTGGAVHVLPQASCRHAPKDPWLLRAPLPGQDVWWGEHSRRAKWTTQRGKATTACISHVINCTSASSPRDNILNNHLNRRLCLHYISSLLFLPVLLSSWRRSSVSTVESWWPPCPCLPTQILTLWPLC